MPQTFQCTAVGQGFCQASALRAEFPLGAPPLQDGTETVESTAVFGLKTPSRSSAAGQKPGRSPDPTSIRQKFCGIRRKRLPHMRHMRQNDTLSGPED